MSAEIPQPERDSGPEVRLFNVDAMNDDQIIVLYRGVYSAGDIRASEARERGLLGQVSVADELCDHLTAAVRDIAAHDPQRVRSLVEFCAHSSEKADRDFAACTVRSLAPHDYEFARDTLISFMLDERQQRRSWDSVAEAAEDEASIMMRDHTTAEQVADFNARLLAYGEHGDVIHPAPPVEH
jgi:hypothetical protein